LNLIEVILAQGSPLNAKGLGMLARLAHPAWFSCAERGNRL
jgi:hypothetical protein